MVLYFCLVLFGTSMGADISAQAAKAQTLEQQGKFSDAIEAWQQLLRIDPSDAAALASIGIDYSRLGRYQEASAEYRKALAIRPNLPGIHLNLGLAEFKQGRFESAIPALEAASRQSPQNGQA